MIVMGEEKKESHTDSDVKLHLKSGFGLSNIAVIRR